MNALPDKLSDLIELALNDLAEVERDPRYSVEMWDWHEKKEDYCSVCLAGAVMAKTLGVPYGKTSFPDYFANEKIERALNAIDRVRIGFVGSALHWLNSEMNEDLVSRMNRKFRIRLGQFQPYSINSDEFKTTMQKIATDLREMGY